MNGKDGGAGRRVEEVRPRAPTTVQMNDSMIQKCSDDDTAVTEQDGCDEGTG